MSPDLLRVGSSPQGHTTKWKQLTQTTEVSLTVFLTRWIEDFEKTPPLFRKQRTAEEVVLLLSATSLFCTSKNAAAQALPADQFRSIEVDLMEQFRNGDFDAELTELVRSRPETFEWEMLSCLRSAVSVGHDAVARDNENREKATADILAESTYEDIKAQVDGDCARLEHFLDKRVQWQHDSAKLEAKYNSELRAAGAAAAASFADIVAFFTPHLTKNGKAIDPEFSDAALRPAKYVGTIQRYLSTTGTADIDKVYFIHVLDYLVFAGVDVPNFKDSITTAATMSTVGGSSADHHIIAVVLPMATSTVDGVHAIKHRRTVEDALVGANLDCNLITSIVFAPPEHGSEKKCRSNWVVLACKSSGTNSFRQSKLASGAAGSNELNLIRAKDIDVYDNIDENALPPTITKDAIHRGTHNASRVERSRQRGNHATKAILRDLLTDSDLPQNATVCIVDYNPCEANDWGCAALLLALDKVLAQPVDPPLAQTIKSITFTPNVDAATKSKVRAIAFSYQEWFAGRASLPRCGRIASKDLPEHMRSYFLPPTSYLLPPTAYLLPPASHLPHPPPTSCLLPPTSYLLPPTSYLLPPTSYTLPPTSYLLPPTSHLLPPTSYLLPPTSYLLPPTSYLLPPTSYLLPPTSYFLPPTPYLLPPIS